MRIRTHLQKKSFSKSPAVKPIQKKKLSSLHGMAQAKPQGQSLEEMRISRANAERLGDHMVNLSGTSPAQPIQTKLTIGEVGDKYEQEADTTAAQVVKQINSPEAQNSGQGGSVQRDAMAEEEENVQMKAEDNVQRDAMPEEEEENVQMKPESSIQRDAMAEEEEENVQMKAETNVQRDAMPEEEEENVQMKPESALQRQSTEGGTPAGQDIESSIEQSRGQGQRLDDNIRGPMEQAFGADFSGVTIHTDSQSDQLNKSIQARAFTTGQDVYFRQGAYNPNSQDGQELIAHEFTHVMQQNGSAVQAKDEA